MRVGAWTLGQAATECVSCCANAEPAHRKQCSMEKPASHGCHAAVRMCCKFPSAPQKHVVCLFCQEKAAACCSTRSLHSRTLRAEPSFTHRPHVMQVQDSFRPALSCSSPDLQQRWSWCASPTAAFCCPCSPRALQLGLSTPASCCRCPPLLCCYPGCLPQPGE